MCGLRFSWFPDRGDIRSSRRLARLARGPRGDGTSLETNVPIQWNAETSDNLRWKTALPGGGHASPIVWDDRIFLVACLDKSEERILSLPRSAHGKNPLAANGRALIAGIEACLE